MQRQFYAALFRKLKSIGNIWDVAKLTPAVLNYMETNLSASDLISGIVQDVTVSGHHIIITAAGQCRGKLIPSDTASVAGS